MSRDRLLLLSLLSLALAAVFALVGWQQRHGRELPAAKPGLNRCDPRGSGRLALKTRGRTTAEVDNRALFKTYPTLTIAGGRHKGQAGIVLSSLQENDQDWLSVIPCSGQALLLAPAQLPHQVLVLNQKGGLKLIEQGQSGKNRPLLRWLYAIDRVSPPG